MKEELMFNINAMDINNPLAKVFDAERRSRCAIKLGTSVHLWHLDIVVGAYRLYWTAKGYRDPSFNVADGVTYYAVEDGRDEVQEMLRVSKEIIERVCRSNDTDRPNLLKKLEENRYVLLKRNNANGNEIITSGGFERPKFFIRHNGDIKDRYRTFEDAVANM